MPWLHRGTCALKNGTCHSKRSLLWEIKDAGTGCYVILSLQAF